jgi:hypothetical protein
MDEARRLEVLIGRPGEIARVEGLAARVTGVVDAFHMYASMLERFRKIHEAMEVPPLSPQPLAAVADDERVLLSCRAALRRAMQQLIAAIEADQVAPQMNGGIEGALRDTGPLRPAQAVAAGTGGTMGSVQPKRHSKGSARNLAAARG